MLIALLFFMTFLPFIEGLRVINVVNFVGVNGDKNHIYNRTYTTMANGMPPMEEAVLDINTKFQNHFQLRLVPLYKSIDCLELVSYVGQMAGEYFYQGRNQSDSFAFITPSK
jgi:hypothetical protein